MNLTEVLAPVDGVLSIVESAKGGSLNKWVIDNTVQQRFGFDLPNTPYHHFGVYVPWLAFAGDWQPWLWAPSLGAWVERRVILPTAAQPILPGWVQAGRLLHLPVRWKRHLAPAQHGNEKICWQAANGMLLLLTLPPHGACRNLFELVNETYADLHRAKLLATIPMPAHVDLFVPTVLALPNPALRVGQRLRCGDTRLARMR